MAFFRCQNCGEPIKSGKRQKFCGVPCRDEARRKKQDAESKQLAREKVGLGPRPPVPATLSIRQGWAALAGAVGDYDDFHGRMRPGAVERRARQDLTSPPS